MHKKIMCLMLSIHFYFCYSGVQFLCIGLDVPTIKAVLDID